MKLKERLRLIHAAREQPRPPLVQPCPSALPDDTPVDGTAFEGWQTVDGCAGLLSRTVTVGAGEGEGPRDAERGLWTVPPEALFRPPVSEPPRALLPDLDRLLAEGFPFSTSRLTFFDLETTGLSGGAGTLAFLAAFGTVDGRGALSVTQVLLLDYPDEARFLQKCAERLTGLVISYNGKSFDSQIIKNRCVMNAQTPPEYAHADLVYPARYLWKRTLFSCGQKDIEEYALGIRRTDDLPGRDAPDAWLSFLRTGDNRRLLRVCAHNLADIAGLYAVWDALCRLSARPLETWRGYHADIERLALRYRVYLKRSCRRGCPAPLESEERALRLLETAALEGGEVAALLWKRRYDPQLVENRGR